MADLRTFDKVKFGAAGAGLGGAVAQIIVWLLTFANIDAAPIEVSLSVVLAAFGSFAAGWFKREGVISEEFTDADGDGAAHGVAGV